MNNNNIIADIANIIAFTACQDVFVVVVVVVVIICDCLPVPPTVSGIYSLQKCW